MSKEISDDSRKGQKEFGEEYGGYVGDKQGGVHKGDPLGGRYDKKDESGKVTDRYLVKRDGNAPQNDIAEYVASRIFETVAPEQGASLELVRRTDKDPDTQENPFLASKFFQGNYQDFYQEAGYQDRPRALEAVQSNLPDAAQYVKQELNKEKYTGYGRAIAASLLVGDYSMHSGNMGTVDDVEKGAVRNIEGKRKIVRIDFGAAFRRETFEDQINPFKSNPEKIKIGPITVTNEKNYFLRDHPKERIISQEFADALKEVANTDLRDTVNWAMESVNNKDKGFTKESIKAFGQQIGAKNWHNEPEIQPVQNKLQERLKTRQQGLKNMATEIELKLLDKDIKKNGLGEEQKEKLTKIVEENPKHAKQILEQGKSGSEMQLSYSKELKQALGSELKKQGHEVADKAQDKTEAKSTVKKVIKKVTKNLPPDLIREAKNIGVAAKQVASEAKKAASKAADTVRKKVTGKNNDGHGR